MRRVFAVAAACMLMAVPKAAYATDLAEELQNTLNLILDKALSVHITARITEGERETVWNMELTRVTISGRAVAVRLEGSNLVVNVEFTPYREEDDSILLVAQGQTWLSDDGEESVIYHPTFQSLPVSLGEPVVFFPLGTEDDGEPVPIGSFNIELEIRISPFVEPAEQS